MSEILERLAGQPGIIVGAIFFGITCLAFLLRAVLFLPASNRALSSARKNSESEQAQLASAGFLVEIFRLYKIGAAFFLLSCILVDVYKHTFEYTFAGVIAMAMASIARVKTREDYKKLKKVLRDENKE